MLDLFLCTWFEYVWYKMIFARKHFQGSQFSVKIDLGTPLLSKSTSFPTSSSRFFQKLRWPNFAFFLSFTHKIPTYIHWPFFIKMGKKESLPDSLSKMVDHNKVKAILKSHLFYFTSVNLQTQCYRRWVYKAPLCITLLD